MMKRIGLIIGLLFSIFTFNKASCQQDFSDKTKTVHRAIKKAIITIQKRYELQLAGISEATDMYNEERYKEVGLCLVSKKYLSKSEGRKIVLDVSNILLEHLNQEEVKPYLTVNPFTLKNIDIGITFQILEKDKDYSKFQSCGTFLGKLFYWYDAPNTKRICRKEYESYEEALSLYEQDGDISTPISITNSDKPKKRSWWSRLFG
jgi:hypothetical protein